VQSEYADLYGYFKCSIDIKHRLLICSEIRRQLLPERDGPGFFVVIGKNRKLWLYPENTYRAMARGAPQKRAPTMEELEYDQLHYGLAEYLDCDKTGRVLLPDPQMKATGTGKDVMLWGVRNHIEIWNRPEFEAHSRDLWARQDEISKVIDQGPIDSKTLPDQGT
jgi:MraZ protein